MKKQVVTSVEKGVNYFFHVQAVSKINYDSKYAAMYNKSIYEKDIKFLKDNEELFLFGNGQSLTTFTVLFLFLPALLNLNNSNRINNYFDKLCYLLKEKEASVFIKEYENAINKVEKLHNGYRKVLIEKIDMIMSNYFEEVVKVAEIFKRNYKIYNEKVWPKEKLKLIDKAKELKGKLSKTNIINNFEKITGKKYKSPKFKVVLCSANNNGPDANDLGYDKNVHFYNRDIKDMIRMISHEIGVRILFPMKNIVNKQNDYLIYDALESIAEFYNRKVLDIPKNEMFNRLKMIKVYEEIYTNTPDISAEDLFKTGLVKVQELENFR